MLLTEGTLIVRKIFWAPFLAVHAHLFRSCHATRKPTTPSPKLDLMHFLMLSKMPHSSRYGRRQSSTLNPKPYTKDSGMSSRARREAEDDSEFGCGFSWVAVKELKFSYHNGLRV